MQTPFKRPSPPKSLPNRVRHWIHRIQNGLIAAMRWLPVPELLIALGLLLVWEAIR